MKKKLPDYRRTYLTSNRGLAGGHYYICGYCYRPVKRRDMQVDHIFPKSKVVGAIAVNDSSNLLSSCEHCNKSKGAKGGLWIVRGIVGKGVTSIIYTLGVKGLTVVGTIVWFYIVIIR